MEGICRAIWTPLGRKLAYALVFIHLGSDAGIFPCGFRAVGLGKIIGVPVYGAVSGTGALRLMDGSSIRAPSFRVFTAKGENMEEYSVPPDVLIDNTPADFLAGRDAQIEKAVEVLRAEIK